MSILTTFFNLIKPAKTDGVKVKDFNDNMDIIDEEMHKPPLTVNGTAPDSTTRNLTLTEVPLAGNLSSDIAQINQGTFVERTSGGSTSISDGAAFLTSVKGSIVHTGQVPESLEMTVNATGEENPITATIDRDTFVSYVSTSGTITLSYTSAWSADPALYGVTVSGTPENGDSIVIVYVKENRGTITTATPSAFNSTGWNLYNNADGVKYARVVKYSDEYGYKIGGNYSLVYFSTTVSGEQSAVTISDGYFNVPSDGFVHVSGGDATTYIYQTWTDWTDDYQGDFQTYTVSTIDLSAIVGVLFTNGMAGLGLVADEINLNTQQVIQRIGRLAYSAENLETVIASGADYDADTNYIYYVLSEPVLLGTLSLDGEYSVSDHGIEFYEGTTVPLNTEVLYGENLKDKLRTDVLTISAQTLTATQKAQVQENLSVPGLDKTFTSERLGTITDANNLNLIGKFFRSGSQCANLPTSDGTFYLVLCFGDGDQIAMAHSNSGFKRFFARSYINSTWMPWTEFGRKRGQIDTVLISLETGWSATTYEVQVGQGTAIVQFNGLTRSSGATGWTTIGTIGNGIVAAKRVCGVLACDNSMSSGRTSVAECRINTDGTIDVYSPQGGEKYWGGFAFFLG